MATNKFGFTSVVIAGLLLTSGTGFAASFMTGDIFASVSSGLVNWYRADGSFVQALNTGLGGFTTGSASDADGNLYVTDFSVNNVSKFDTSGTLLGTFGSGYNAAPESILFDATGNVFVGQADGTHHVLQFNAAGTLLNTFAPAIEDRGTDWIDLAADQHTLYYTSEGTTIKRFDTATNTQLADFATGFTGKAAYALRILSDGGVLVADTQRVLRLDSAGTVIQTYTPTNGTGTLFALNLDPDGTSFWTGDADTGILYKVNISTGAVEQTLNTGAGGNALFGVSVFREITAATVPEPRQVALALVLCGLLVVVHRLRKAAKQPQA